MDKLLEAILDQWGVLGGMVAVGIAYVWHDRTKKNLRRLEGELRLTEEFRSRWRGDMWEARKAAIEGITRAATTVLALVDSVRGDVTLERREHAEVIAGAYRNAAIVYERLVRAQEKLRSNVHEAAPDLLDEDVRAFDEIIAVAAELPQLLHSILGNKEERDKWRSLFAERVPVERIKSAHEEAVKTLRRLRGTIEYEAMLRADAPEKSPRSLQ